MCGNTAVKDAIVITDFTYYCYRCGGKNSLDVEIPKAPDCHRRKKLRAVLAAMAPAFSWPGARIVRNTYTGLMT